MSSDKSKCVPRSAFPTIQKVPSFIKEHLDHRFGGLKVRIIEFILDIPAKRSETFAFLDQTVEETGTQNQFVETGFLDTVVQKGVRELQQATLKVGLNTAGRLCGEFDAILEDADWEIVGGHGG